LDAFKVKAMLFHNPVFVFGAGATAACGGPQTNELLPKVFQLFAQSTPGEREDETERSLREKITTLIVFLRESFHVDVDEHGVVGEGAVFPSVPLLLSYLNTALDRAQPIGTWTPARLVSLRIAVQVAFLLALIDIDEPKRQTNPYVRLLKPLYEQSGSAMPVAITLNYDSILDKAMLSLGSRAKFCVPDYGCDLAIDGSPDAPRFGRLLKLHGSLNWLFCRRCSRLSLHMAGLYQGQDFWASVGDAFADLDVFASFTEATACVRCKSTGALSPLIITPSVLKDYRNPHVSRIWYEAEQELRQADRVIFVGYSLPWDDVEVIYLVKQSLQDLPPERITVVEYSQSPVPIGKHDAGSRYLSLFGKQIGWSSLGFSGWLDDCERRKVSPLEL
jgi:NAD-dependent SIR2 family protein deacetylase